MSEEHGFERKRHREKWKGVACKVSHPFKKHYRGGDSMKESESPSLRESSSCTELDRNDSDVVSPANSDFVSGTTSTTQQDIPPPLSGGVVLDTKYAVSAAELNAIIFEQGSAFTSDLLRTQKSSDYVAEPWRRTSDGSVTRSVSYTRAATKLVKAVRAKETQRYVVVRDEGFCVLLSSSTPDAPYGSTFVVETQVVILALPDLPSGENSCHLQVSWQLKFLHSTMMKPMIESGVRSGIGESYAVYEEVLSHHAPLLSLPRSAQTSDSEGEKLISDWETAWDLFTQWDVLLALLSLSFILLHIALASPKPSSGLEFWIIRFPDSLMELLVSAIVVVQVESVAIMVYNFTRSYYLQSADHEVKAQGGDGWIVKASLLEGVNIAHCQSGTPSPFVVFTCNNKHRTSSPNLGTTHPTWQEVFEFDPVEDPPSTMEVEVFHYEGPFSEAESLGRGEINFLKRSPGELADFWLPLQRKGSQENGSELHLCVYLVNAREGDTILPEYLERIEREVGLKVRKRSAHKNGSFQKLFSLPAEEFLMNDFACAIKRKILIQGRLYLSPRLLGFYSNLFGHKTKFMLLWEDIEEIKESVAQSINPSITVFTRKGSCYDARHGARGVDGKGRLKFQLSSFVRSGSAFRAIVALWKNVNLSKVTNMDVSARLEAGDMKYTTVADDLRKEEADASMSEVLQMQIPITVESVNVVIEDDQKDRLLHEKLGISNYESSPWEVVADGIRRRHRHYTLERPITQLGSKISSVQQKTTTSGLDFNKLVIDDNFTFDEVPCGTDHFQMQVRMELEALSMHPVTTLYKAFGGVVWHEGTELDQRKMTKNVYEHMTNQLRCLVQLLVEEAS